jgi:hypothetical protein
MSGPTKVRLNLTFSVISNHQAHATVSGQFIQFADSGRSEIPLRISGLHRALSNAFGPPRLDLPPRYIAKSRQPVYNDQARHFGASKMRKLFLTIAMAATVVGLQATSQIARAADIGVYGREPSARVTAGGHCSRQWFCGPEGCGWQRFCRVGCPDRYMCSSLYGAYGPWGGTAYWGAYTSVGWGRSYY